MKAFLSHATLDKEFVRAIADHLGRQYCIFDERAFETGVEFKDSIEKGLNDSSVFVLFASKASLKSLWVNFEVGEAWFLVLEKKLRQSLVFIIDSSVEINDIPKWLQRAKIARAVSPAPTARIIRDHIDNLRNPEQKLTFIGRSDDVENIQQMLSPWDGSPPPKTIILHGLPYIGRRSLIRHICPFTLNLDRIDVILIEEGDSLTDFAIKLADQVEAFSTAQGFKFIVEAIRALPDAEVLKRIVKDLQLCISNRELPVIVDGGGLLDGSGRFTAVISQILAAIPVSNDCYLFIVSNRRPLQEGFPNIPSIGLKELKVNDSKSLIAALAQRRGLKVKAGEIADLASYAGGFPPSCIYAVQLAVDYGLLELLNNKRRLVEFRTLPFIKYLADRKLIQKELDVLRILAEYSPLPLAVIGKVLQVNAEELSLYITKLIDYSLINPAKEGFYAIAEPIIDAVYKATRLLLKPSEHLAIAEELKYFIDNNEMEGHVIDAYRILYRSARNSNNPVLADEALHLANDVIRLLERSYHSRNYEQAIGLGREAVATAPQSINAHDFLIRALIQENLWAEAHEALTKFEVVGPQRDFFFLKGFLHRKKGEFALAIDFFKRAEKAGRAGASLKRELASCYAIEGNLGEAEKYLQQALRNNWDNPFLMDLGVKVATQMGDEKLAKERLEQLKEIEAYGFYQHRLSHVELRFGRVVEALDAARSAVASEQKPTFEMLGQLAICEIRTGGLDEAEKNVHRLERDFPRNRPDFRFTLRAHIELDRRHYSNAIILLDKRVGKNDPLYYQLRQRCIEGELENGALTDAKRIEYTKEVERISKIRAGKPTIQLDALLDL